jgi:hypothetical protein
MKMRHRANVSELLTLIAMIIQRMLEDKPIDVIKGDSPR